MERNVEFLKESLIAHRGMHNIKKGIPENSIIAFEKAIENNYIIEFDVHILRDGTVVVFHDDNLNRMTGVNKDVKDVTYNEIESLKLQDTKYGIPVFQEVLDLVNGKVPIIIELKYDVKTGILEQAVMNLLSKYEGKYVVKSFNPNAVHWLKKNYPNVLRGQLSSNFKNNKMNILKKIYLKSMIYNLKNKPDFISYDISALPSKRIEKMRKKMLILGWTVRNSNELEKAQKYTDNFICENFEELDIG